eukprot:7623123-Pyramimonas_sp.AAC.1
MFGINGAWPRRDSSTAGPLPCNCLIATCSLPAPSAARSSARWYTASWTDASCSSAVAEAPEGERAT